MYAGVHNGCRQRKRPCRDQGISRKPRHLSAGGETPVVVTRHGDTVGYFIPARSGRIDAERSALHEAARRLQKMLASEGISEDEIARDFSRWRTRKRK